MTLAQLDSEMSVAELALWIASDSINAAEMNQKKD